MSVELVILGFLREKDYHGYELKKEIQRRMGQWTDIKFGSIYHALRKLVEKGAVIRLDAEKQQGKPDRYVYRISDKGRNEFLHMVDELLNRMQRIFHEVDIGLYFASDLQKEDLSNIFRKRIIQYEERIKFLNKVKQTPTHLKLPKISELIVDHSIHQMGAEIMWHEKVIDRVDGEDLFNKE